MNRADYSPSNLSDEAMKEITAVLHGAVRRRLGIIRGRNKAAGPYASNWTAYENWFEVNQNYPNAAKKLREIFITLVIASVGAPADRTHAISHLSELSKLATIFAKTEHVQTYLEINKKIKQVIAVLN